MALRLSPAKLAVGTALALFAGAGWFVLTPLLVLLAAELDGYAPQ